MKIFEKNGTKERLLEMFQQINKVNINEKKIVNKTVNKQYNEWGKIVKPSRVNESTDLDKYENVVFLQGEEAIEPLEILNRKGEEAALEYLKQWHHYGEHEGTNQLGAGTSDRTFNKDGYIMSYNPNLGYIGLQYDLQQGENNVEESFDNPKEKDEHYLNKGNVADVLKQTKKDDGVRYPVEDKLKVKDNSLENMKGDDEPIIQKENEDEFERGEVPGGQDTNANEYEAENGEENSNDEVEITTPDEIEGGLGDDASITSFDSDQISKGIKVEMEHTNDPKIALEIVLDHLSEDEYYYGTDEENPEDAAMKGAQADVEDPSDEKEVLWGNLDTVGEMGTDNELEDLNFEYQPKNVGEDFDFASQERDFYDKQNMNNDLDKFQQYQTKDFNSLSDDEKEEFFRLWKTYKEN